MLLVLLCCSCFSFQTKWERVEASRFTAPDGSMRVELPEGWALSGTLLTRDGTSLQWISFQRASEELAKMRADLEDELARSEEVSNASCAQVTIGGRPATEIRLEAPPRPPYFLFDFPDDGWFGDEASNTYLMYWITDGDREFLLAYCAPTLYYFERDLPAFEHLVASFEPLPPRSPDARLPR